MAAIPRTSIPAELRRLFPTRCLNVASRESGLVVRRRKVTPAAFFWSVVLGSGTGHRRSIAALRKFFAATTGVALVPSARDHQCRGVEQGDAATRLMAGLLPARARPVPPTGPFARGARAGRWRARHRATYVERLLAPTEAIWRMFCREG